MDSQSRMKRSSVAVPRLAHCMQQPAFDPKPYGCRSVDLRSTAEVPFLGFGVVSPELVGCWTVLSRGKNWVLRWCRADGGGGCDDR